MHDFQGSSFQDQSDFPGLSRSWNFQEKIQDFPGGMGTMETTILKLTKKNLERFIILGNT